MTTTKKTTAAKQAIEQVEAAARAQKETVEAVVKASTEAVAKGYEQAVELTKEQVDKAGSYAFGGYGEFADFGKDNLDALAQTSGAVTKGVEQLGKEVSAYGQSALENGVTTAKKLFAAQSVQEIVALQQAWVRENFDAAWSEGARLQEMSLKIATTAAEPLNARLNATLDRIGRPDAG